MPTSFMLETSISGFPTVVSNSPVRSDANGSRRPTVLYTYTSRLKRWRSSVVLGARGEGRAAARTEAVLGPAETVLAVAGLAVAVLAAAEKGFMAALTAAACCTLR